MNFDKCDFENMRPFRDDEIPCVMQRICEDKNFPLIAKWVYPEKSSDEVKKLLLGFSNVHDFQVETMRRVNERVIDTTTDGMTYEGMEHIDKNKRYLFISNHRDIMLDACFLQYILWQNGHETSEITFGSNLMGMQIVDDIGKANKMFKVERSGSMREFYNSSLLLSQYIHHTILQKRQSVWIAQRNGRTKNGTDRTEPGLIKMLMLAAEPGHYKQALLDLNIIPMSVSYEWEPCDILKAVELYESIGKKYVKKPGEDLNSILTGIRQAKGRVHIQLCNPITAKDLADCTEDDQQALIKTVSRILDQRIREGYRLWPNNYIALDIIKGDNTHSAFYTKSQRSRFETHIESATKNLPEPAKKEILHILLGIYSNAVS